MAKDRSIPEDTFVQEKRGAKVKRTYERHKFATGVVVGVALGLVADVAAGIFKEKREAVAVESDPWVDVNKD
jgi:hypothetical protein